ncbi:hypothetical protein GCM10008986_07870 [Salinibacillus aidingensis]|uniref:Periplasmic binding protein domain-containing protein n=1 Tax=Salinibacillus aidingensis TaxID=237684 RepID=A0ABN1AW22_9BACI
MKDISVYLGYSIGFLLFIICFGYTLYFGKQTFHLDQMEVSQAQNYDYHFVLIPEEKGSEYWHLVREGAMETAEQHHAYLEYVGGAQTSEEEQFRTLDKAIDAKVDGILTQGMEGERFVELVHLAREKGIPVVTVDADNPKSERNAYVGTDNFRAGYLAGEAFVNETTGKQNVAIIIGRSESPNQQKRIEGFQKAIDNEERVQVITIEESNISIVGAAQATYQALKKHSEINGFFGTNVLAGIGISQAITQTNRKQNPYIVTFDTLPKTLDLMRDGIIDATIVQHPYRMGKTGINLLLDAGNSKYVEPVQYTPSSILYKEDIHKAKYGEEYSYEINSQ